MNNTGARQLVCLGCGYVATALAGRLQARGWKVAGSTRDPDRAEQLRLLGIDAFDPTPASVAELLCAGSHLLLSAAPTSQGDPFLLSLEETLFARRHHIRWIGYLSSTSVYGDTGGAWVEETSPCNAGFERGKRRIAAELQWRRLGCRMEVPVVVFRLAGIYGPGRNQLEQVRDGGARRIAKPGQVFSRIHVDDIAAALEAAILGHARDPVFNLADDEPAATPDVVEYAAGLLRLAPPPRTEIADPSISPRLRAMYSECRRVSNRRMKARLLPQLAYPTYREGLQAILDAENS